MPAHRKPITAAWVWSQIDQGEPDECWPWGGVYFTDGYGRIRNHHAHRVVWSIVHGYMPAAEFPVRHACDNPPCCNPAHLLLGTHEENMHDMMARGRGRSGAQLRPERMPRGEANHKAKLTEAQVNEIRVRYAAGGVRQVDLASEFGVSQPMIGYIVRGENWTHL
jgi:hypothetical protein